MRPLVSVIVPVYNVAKYLRRCLDSLVAQTYEPIEIILVDDGSTDGSSAICDEYMKDSRARVIHQDNQGLSAARNAGLDTMRGEYVMFVDSDDYVSPGYVQKPMEIIESFPEGDIVCFPHYEDVKGKLRLQREDCYDGKFQTVLEIQKAYLRGKIEVTAWAKLYRSTLWKTHRFPVGKCSEDMFILPYVFLEAQHILFLDEPLYYWNRGNASSLTRTAEKNTNILVSTFYAMMENEKVAKIIGDEALIHEIRARDIKFAVRLYYRNYYYQDMTDSDFAALNEYLQALWIKENLRYCRCSTRLQFWLIHHAPSLAQFYGRKHYASRARRHERFLSSLESTKE